MSFQVYKILTPTEVAPLERGQLCDTSPAQSLTGTGTLVGTVGNARRFPRARALPPGSVTYPSSTSIAEAARRAPRPAVIGVVVVESKVDSGTTSGLGGRLGGRGDPGTGESTD